MAEEFHIELGEDILAFLAQRVRTNVRRLEGALMRVACYLSLSSREISCETVERLLRDILREEAKKPVTIDQIQKKVAEQFDVRLADMTSKRRTANIAFPRQVAMYLARRHTKASLHEIGETFGGRDHGTGVARLQNCLCAHEERGPSPPSDCEARYTARQIPPCFADAINPQYNSPVPPGEGGLA